jgi:hypothetical protein
MMGFLWPADADDELDSEQRATLLCHLCVCGIIIISHIHNTFGVLILSCVI